MNNKSTSEHLLRVVYDDVQRGVLGTQGEAVVYLTLRSVGWGTGRGAIEPGVLGVIHNEVLP